MAAEVKQTKISLESSLSEDSSDYPPPPDGGWGWVVVFASFMVHLISDGTSFAFGVLYVNMLDLFHESSGKTAIVGSLYVSVPLLAGPLAGVIVEKLGCRKSVIISGFLTSTGYLLSIFAPSVEILCVTLGLISGLGLATGFVAAIVAIVFYFEKRRSLATGLATCGSGIGCFVFAPFLQYLIEQYGFHGTMLILAGIFLNLCVFGALLRPLQWTDDDEDNDDEGDDEDESESEVNSTDARDEVKKILSDLRTEVITNLSVSPDDISHIKCLSGHVIVPCITKKPDFLSHSLQVLPGLGTPSQAPFSDDNRLALQLGHPCEKRNHEPEETINKIHLTSPGSIDEIIVDGSSAPDVKWDIDYETKQMPLLKVETHNNEAICGHNQCHHYKCSVSLPEFRREMSSKILPKTLEVGQTEEQNTGSLRVPEDAWNDFPVIIKDDLPNHTCKDQTAQHYQSLPSSLSSSHQHLPFEKVLPPPRLLKPKRRQTEFYHSSEYKKPTLGRVASIRRPPPSMITQPPPRRASIIASRRASLYTRRHSLYTRRQSTALPKLQVIMDTARDSSGIQGENNVDVSEMNASTIFAKMPIYTYLLGDDRTVSPKRLAYSDNYKMKAVSCPDVFLNVDTLPHSKQEPILFEQFRKAMKSMIDVSMLRNMMFLLFWVSNLILYMWYDIPYMYITDHAIAMNISEESATLLVSIIGIANVVGLVSIGYFGDQRRIQSVFLYSICIAVCGVSVMLVPFLVSHLSFVIFASVYGFFIGANYALTSIILCDLLGLDKFASAYGLVCLGQGIANAIGPPLAGWLYDITGNYHTSFYLAGFWILFSGLILVAMPCAQKLQQRYQRLFRLHQLYGVVLSSTDNVIVK